MLDGEKNVPRAPLNPASNEVPPSGAARQMRRLLPLALFTVLISSAPAQVDGNSVQTIVTVDGRSAATIPAQSVTVSVKGGAQVTGFTPLRGDDAGLQLLILLDDSARRDLALQYGDVKTFIMSLPQTTQVGVAYMQNGTARFAQAYTSDHAAAAAALRIPGGTVGSNGSPYFVLTDLVQHWGAAESHGGVPLRAGAIRREVLMFTNGVEAYDSGRFDPNNLYVQHAIDESQRAGVIVYAIYVRDLGTAGLADAEANNGQNYLVQLTGATGGKVYYNGTFSSPDFRPYLDDVKRKLDNQYELRFTINAKPSNGPIGLKVKAKGVKIIAPQQVYATAPSK